MELNKVSGIKSTYFYRTKNIDEIAKMNFIQSLKNWWENRWQLGGSNRQCEYYLNENSMFKHPCLGVVLHLEQQPMPHPVTNKMIEATKSMVVNCSPKLASKIDDVQYNDEPSPVICPKYEKPNRNTYKRKRRGRWKHKTGNNRQRGNTANKNRHEKIRHEVEMNIHDDIDDCSIAKDGRISYSIDPDDEEDLDMDLEIIDIDDEMPKYSAPLAATVPATPKKSPIVETPIPSPEVIPSGCIFTKFFIFDSVCKSKSLPSRWMRRQVPQVPQVIAPKERPMTCRLASETESDDNDTFIVFEDSSPRSAASVDDFMQCASFKDRRPRQISECSDDFILFQEDDVVDCGGYDTTDEDFTDSTDDTDSDDESDDDSDCSEYSAVSGRKHDGEHNQPDSGFEEKKVTFNLCPTVHEIRAWKFAYSEARKGKWEQIGRDRVRFEERINELSRILTPILKADHRQKIYEQRFRDD